MNLYEQCGLTSPAGAALLARVLLCVACAAHMTEKMDAISTRLCLDLGTCILPLLQLPGFVQRPGHVQARAFAAASFFLPNSLSQAIGGMVADLTATIEQNISNRADLDTELFELNTKIGKLSKEERVVEKAECDTAVAELSEELTDLQGVVKAPMTGADGDSGNYDFLAIKSKIKMIRQAILMVDSMGHNPQRQRTLAALLQHEPGVPMQDFHSEKVVKIEMVSDFKEISEVKIDDTKEVPECNLQMGDGHNEEQFSFMIDANELRQSWDRLPQAGKHSVLPMLVRTDDVLAKSCPGQSGPDRAQVHRLHG